MECKYSDDTAVYAVYAVLIETLWNVKLIDRAKSHSLFVVLIETLWNVKIDNRKVLFEEE